MNVLFIVLLSDDESWNLVYLDIKTYSYLTDYIGVDFFSITVTFFSSYKE